MSTRWLFVVVLFLAGCAGQAVRVAEPAGARILVTFADPGLAGSALSGAPGPLYQRGAAYRPSLAAAHNARRVAKIYDLQRIDDWPIRPLGVFCVVYAVPDPATLDDVLARLGRDPAVESAQALQKFDTMAQPAATEDPYASLQYALDTLELRQAHRWSTGEGVRIAVVDTGADTAHPELAQQVREQLDFVGRDGGGPERHGTAVGGVIAAVAGNGIGIVGVAPSARLSMLRACWETSPSGNASCDSFTLAKALAHAVESGAHIINLSLGGPRDALLARLLQAAMARGSIVIAAAPPAPGFPSSLPGVIVVGDLDSGEPGSLLRAPGTDVLVPAPGGHFDYASGSSIAAAQVSGVVALLLARRSGLDRDAVFRLLADSRAAEDRSVNACRALAELLVHDGCRSLQAAARD